MWNVERAHGTNREFKRAVSGSRTFPVQKLLACCPQRT